MRLDYRVTIKAEDLEGIFKDVDFNGLCLLNEELTSEMLSLPICRDSNEAFKKDFFTQKLVRAEKERRQMFTDGKENRAYHKRWMLNYIEAANREKEKAF